MYAIRSYYGLIILDEPAAGLNEAETEELAKTIHKIRDDYDCTIFLVEHDMGLRITSYNVCYTKLLRI